MLNSSQMLEGFKTILLRDIAGLERELDLYPDDAAVWQILPGMPNSAGTLILHLTGSTQHFFGAILGKTGYQRNRNAEFSQQNLGRDVLKQEIAHAKQAVLAGFLCLTEDKLEQPFPARITDVELSTKLTIMQLITHFAYHLGQIDYHRRVLTSNPQSANVVSGDALVALA